MDDKTKYFLDQIEKEMQRGIEKHGTFSDFHHAYAVILEELDEMWDEIKRKDLVHIHIKQECIQTADMCLKLLTCFFDENGQPLKRD